MRESLEKVAAAFDTVAATYDDFENRTTRAIRARLYNMIFSLLPTGGSILDINCGTGTDALFLTACDYKVVGLDLSPRMIEQARAKARAYGFQIPFIVGSFTQLTEFVDGRFDIVLSNFGGLNCVKDLRTISGSLAAVTKPNGSVIALLMPRFCLWETGAGIFHGNLQLARRRWKGHALASLVGQEFPVFYHSLASLRGAFAPSFVIDRIVGINIFTPPPSTPMKSFGLEHFLQRLDRIVESLPFIRMMGDHALIRFRRVGSNTKK